LQVGAFSSWAVQGRADNHNFVGAHRPQRSIIMRGSIWQRRSKQTTSSSMAKRPLEDFVGRHRRLFVLTGAGCSTNSGIPDYRDSQGNWKRTQPVNYQAFIGDARTRQRYWARSLIGWRRFGLAMPNDAHHALARLEANGQCEMLLTQNVDRLHQSAGSRQVIDLHGRLDLVRCMGCGAKIPRQEFQHEMERLNADWLALDAADAPDGDA